ncbi:ParB/RepB/Spo0J family partition protein [Nocardia sp. NPDC050712]|uniref:ParB/RepB/Spo0J family partition protein n=1 Tax=Nocardia sp. NPDC050712 TaxID=3155518 RepID=UPI0033DB8A4E
MSTLTDTTAVSDLESSTTPTQPIPNETPTSGVTAAVEALFLSPAELRVDDNVRESFDLGDYPEYLDSISRHGVLVPILAERKPDGIYVIDGQVRTLTALALDCAQVPVWIAPAAELAKKEAEIKRVISQITINDRRIALTDGDRAAGIALALDLGASATRLAEELQTKTGAIKLAGKVGASRTARNLVDAQQLDLEQAALIAEYDAVGDTEAVNRLTSCQRSDFSFQAHRISQDREAARAMLTAALPYAVVGLGVLTEWPDDAEPEYLHYEDLLTTDDQPVGIEQVMADPTRWIVFCDLAEDGEVIDRETGETVDEATVDWSTERKPDCTPAEGKRHAREVERRDRWQPEFFLPASELEAAGLHIPTPVTEEPEPPFYANANANANEGAGQVSVPDSARTVEGTQEPENVPENPEPEIDPEAAEAARVEAEAARAQAEARRIEAARLAEEAAAAKKEAIRRAEQRREELDKQGAAAKAARMEFLTKWLARQSSFAAAIKFVLQSISADAALLDTHDAFKASTILLGIKGWRPEFEKAIESAKPARCQVLLLGLILGAYESTTSKNCWGYVDRRVKRYLEFLPELGYELHEVERAACGQISADSIDITPK